MEPVGVEEADDRSQTAYGGSHFLSDGSGQDHR